MTEARNFPFFQSIRNVTFLEMESDILMQFTMQFDFIAGSFLFIDFTSQLINNQDVVWEGGADRDSFSNF